MTNFLEETKKKLISIDKKPIEITFIGSKDGSYYIKWHEFVKLADFEYDSGYGAQEIASDLAIVFSDNSWLERYEYDGAECWHYKQVPPLRNIKKPTKITVLTGNGGWEGLSGLHEHKEEYG